MSETAAIAEMANRVSKEIFEFFGWKRIALMDQNFPCVDEVKHKPPQKTQSHTHPVDIIFHYLDPYTNKTVYFNVDLKSYSEGSINKSTIKKALLSLAKTTECANNSIEWKEKYRMSPSDYEVRGLLFVYNHDHGFSDGFYKYFHKSKAREQIVKVESLGIAKWQYLHVIEPSVIRNLVNIKHDIADLILNSELERGKYYFFYPDLKLNKTKAIENKCATIEQLCASYLIIEHDEIINDYGDVVKQNGYIIYYSGQGSDYHEFLYLLDQLSWYQILTRKNLIRFRCTNPNINQNAKSFFKRAIATYIDQWGLSDERKYQLENIRFDKINVYVTSFSEVDLGWRESDV